MPDDVPRPPGRRGRPHGSVRVPEPRRGVSVWLPKTAHDKLATIANRNDVSISAILRQIVMLRLR